MSAAAPAQPAVLPASGDWVPTPLYRWTLVQYESTVDSGAFSPRDRFHLINGYVVSKMTQGDRHYTADDLCGEALARPLPPGWYVRVAKPIRLPPNSKPEPDRCVVRGTIRDYTRWSPAPSDVGLVVEIADSSLSEDRAMARVYAVSGIAVYWIVNLTDGIVEVYTEPTATGYASRVDYVVGRTVPMVIEGVEVGQIAVADIMP